MEKCTLNEIMTTSRLVLKRRVHSHDAEMWQVVNANRKFLREYLFWVDGTQSLDDVVKATDFFIQQWYESHNWCYNIFSRSDNHLLGCIDAHNLNFQNHTAELGYWLAKSETGNGYMKEAVVALEEELFKTGFHRVEIHCDKHNYKSAMVAENSDYELEYVSRECLYHYTGLHDKFVYVKFSPYPPKGF
ncbi:MAG: GNAT family N-acetyltransferase [Acetobacter sp.]|nr:GNAT family N-acetyltransferase [Acetobacter sp.]